MPSGLSAGFNVQLISKCGALLVWKGVNVLGLLRGRVGGLVSSRKWGE